MTAAAPTTSGASAGRRLNPLRRERFGQASAKQRHRASVVVTSTQEWNKEDMMNGAKTMLRLPAVMAKVGLKRATIYKRMKAGTFPEPVQIGPRAVAWEEEAVAAWQANLETGVKKAMV